MRILTLLLLLTTSAWAQSVQQSGTVTPGHPAQWATDGVVQDGGAATAGSLTELGVTASGQHICQNSDLQSAAGYQQICIGATTSGGGQISVQNFGTAAAKSLSLNINGTVSTIPASITAPVLSACGTSPVVASNSTTLSGAFTTGTGNPTSCIVTFGDSLFSTAAFCVISPANAAAAAQVASAFIASSTAGGFSVTTSNTNSQKFNYNCQGR